MALAFVHCPWLGMRRVCLSGLSVECGRAGLAGVARRKAEPFRLSDCGGLSGSLSSQANLSPLTGLAFPAGLARLAVYSTNQTDQMNQSPLDVRSKGRACRSFGKR